MESISWYFEVEGHDYKIEKEEKKIIISLI